MLRRQYKKQKPNKSFDIDTIFIVLPFCGQLATALLALCSIPLALLRAITAIGSNLRIKTFLAKIEAGCNSLHIDLKIGDLDVPFMQ